MESYPICPCGSTLADGGCDLLFMGYHYCFGCGDHHRPPVAAERGRLCPVDVLSHAFATADRERGPDEPGSITEADLQRAEREMQAGRSHQAASSRDDGSPRTS